MGNYRNRHIDHKSVMDVILEWLLEFVAGKNSSKSPFLKSEIYSKFHTSTTSIYSIFFVYYVFNLIFKWCIIREEVHTLLWYFWRVFFLAINFLIRLLRLVDCLWRCFFYYWKGHYLCVFIHLTYFFGENLQLSVF